MNNKMPSNGELAVILRLSELAVQAMTWKAKNLRWRKAVKMCLKCPRPAREGRQQCQACREKLWFKALMKQADRMAEGKCRRCDSPPAEGRQMCHRHLTMALAAVVKSQKKRKENEQTN
jgi:hypothetical protein